MTSRKLYFIWSTKNIVLRHDTDGLWIKGVQKLRHKVLYGLKSAREMYPDEKEHEMKKSG